jgi:hypothetical protein
MDTFIKDSEKGVRKNMFIVQTMQENIPKVFGNSEKESIVQTMQEHTLC